MTVIVTEKPKLNTTRKIILAGLFVLVATVTVGLISMSRMIAMQKQIGTQQTKAYELPVSGMGGGQKVIQAMPDAFQNAIQDGENLETQLDPSQLPNFDMWTGSPVR